MRGTQNNSRPPVGRTGRGAHKDGKQAAAATPPPYRVGYARPPKTGQFKPGTSGNPKGRPKGRKNLRTLLSNVLMARIVRREGETRKKVTVVEGMLWKQVESALKGSDRSLLATFKICSALGLLDKARLGDETEPLSPAEQSLVDELMSKVTTKVDKA